MGFRGSTIRMLAINYCFKKNGISPSYLNRVQVLFMEMPCCVTAETQIRQTCREHFVCFACYKWLREGKGKGNKVMMFAGAA